MMKKAIALLLALTILFAAGFSLMMVLDVALG